MSGISSEKIEQLLERTRFYLVNKHYELLQIEAYAPDNSRNRYIELQYIRLLYKSLNYEYDQDFESDITNSLYHKLIQLVSDSYLEDYNVDTTLSISGNEVLIINTIPTVIAALQDVQNALAETLNQYEFIKNLLAETLEASTPLTEFFLYTSGEPVFTLQEVPKHVLYVQVSNAGTNFQYDWSVDAPNKTLTFNTPNILEAGDEVIILYLHGNNFIESSLINDSIITPSNAWSSKRVSSLFNDLASTIPNPDDIEEIINDQIGELMAIIEVISSDSTITPSEKIRLKVEYLNIVSQHNSFMAQIDLYDIDEEGNDYIDAYGDLVIYLSNILNNMTVASVIDATEFNSKFNNYYITRATLLLRIAYIVEENTTQANSTAEGVAAITNFWQLTLDPEHGLLAVGTLLVGTSSQNNAGLTGVTEHDGDSVRFWLGGNYANRQNAITYFRDNGKWKSGNEISSVDWGITVDGRFTIKGGILQDRAGNTGNILLYRGDWDNVTTYAEGNTVSYGGGLWLWKNVISGNSTPVEGNDWTVHIPKAADGQQGPAGTSASKTEFKWAKNGSTTIPPTLNTGIRNPAGWSIVQPTLDDLEYLWETSSTISPDNSFTPWTTPVRKNGKDGVDGNDGNDGNDGAPGPIGPFIAGRGLWNNTKEYYGKSTRVEVVEYNEIWYVSRVDVQNSGNPQGLIPIGTLPTNGTYWNEFDAQFESIATGLFFTNLAFINNLGVNNLRTSDTGKRIEIIKDTNNITLYDYDDYAAILIDDDNVYEETIPGTVPLIVMGPGIRIRTANLSDGYTNIGRRLIETSAKIKVNNRFGGLGTTEITHEGITTPKAIIGNFIKILDNDYVASPNDSTIIIVQGGTSRNVTLPVGTGQSVRVVNKASSGTAVLFVIPPSGNIRGWNDDTYANVLITANSSNLFISNGNQWHLVE